MRHTESVNYNMYTNISSLYTYSVSSCNAILALVLFLFTNAVFGDVNSHSTCILFHLVPLCALCGECKIAVHSMVRAYYLVLDIDCPLKKIYEISRAFFL